MFARSKTLISIFTSVVILSGCGKTILQAMGGGSTSVMGLNPAPPGEGFYDRCGIRVSDLTDPSATLLDQRLRALINIQGTQSDIKFDITLEANVHAFSTAGSSLTETIVKVKENKSEDGGRVTTDMAALSAYNASNRITAEAMSNGLLLKLQKTDPMFSGVECAVSFTGKSTTETAEGVGTVEFSPGLPTAVNPMASLATLDSEIGASRAFTAKANVLAAGKDWAPVGTSVDVTATIKKITGGPQSVSGMPQNAPAITSDVAYEVVMTSSLGDVSKIGLSKRQVFFINTQSKSLTGVLVETGNYDPKLKKEYPPTVAVPVTE